MRSEEIPPLLFVQPRQVYLKSGYEWRSQWNGGHDNISANIEVVELEPDFETANFECNRGAFPAFVHRPNSKGLGVREKPLLKTIIGEEEAESLCNIPTGNARRNFEGSDSRNIHVAQNISNNLGVIGQ